MLKYSLFSSCLLLLLFLSTTACSSTPTRDSVSGVPDDFEIEYFSNDLSRGRTRYLTFQNDGYLYFLGGPAAKQQSLESGNRKFDPKQARNKRKLHAFEIRELWEFVQKNNFIEAKGEWFPEARRLYKLSIKTGDQSNSFNSGNDRVPNMEELGNLMTRLALKNKYDSILNQVDVRKREIELQRERELDNSQP